MTSSAAPTETAKEVLIKPMILQPIDDRLTPANCAILLIDYQLQFAQAINSTDGDILVQNGVNLAKTAKTFSIPAVLTTIGQASFGGPLFSKLQEIFPDQEPIDRMTLSVFEDARVVAAMERIGRNRLVIAGLWTDFGVSASTQHARRLGYEIFMVVDACGDVTGRTHHIAIERLCREGAVPVTWLQIFLALHRHWAPPEAYGALLNIAKDHASAYGLEIQYAPSRFEKRQARLTNHKPRERRWLYAPGFGTDH